MATARRRARRYCLVTKEGYHMHPMLTPDSGQGQQSVVDAQGITRYDGVAAGDWPLTVSLNSGHLRQVIIRLQEGEEGKQVRVQLGHSSIQGHVFDAHGTPAAGAIVSWSSRGKPDHGFWSMTTTGVDGSYRLDHLLPGSAWLTHRSSELQVRDMSTIRVPETGPLVWNFGSPRGTVNVRCRLETSSGEIPVGTFALNRNLEPGVTFRQFPVKNPAEPFELKLEPGDWTVHMNTATSPWTPRVEVASWRVEGPGPAHTLTVPGYRISGTLHSPEADQPGAIQDIALRQAGGDHVYREAIGTDEDHWVIDAVLPAEYDIWGEIRCGDLSATQRVEVLDGDLVVSLVAH